CRTALGRYRVLQMAAWREPPDFRYLAPQDQVAVRRDVQELLFLLARAVGLQFAWEAEARPRKALPSLALRVRKAGLHLVNALHLNRLALDCCETGHVSRALLQQRADLLRQQGDKEEARRLEELAHAVPLRTAWDHYLEAHRLAGWGRFRAAL